LFTPGAAPPPEGTPPIRALPAAGAVPLRGARLAVRPLRTVVPAAALGAMAAVAAGAAGAAGAMGWPKVALAGSWPRVETPVEPLGADAARPVGARETSRGAGFAVA
jgi:hypothetical protein